MPAKYSIQLQSIDHPLVGSSSCNCQAISRIVREKIVLSLQWCLDCQIQRHRLYDYRIIAVNGAGTSTSEPTELSKCIYVTEIYKWLLFNTFVTTTCTVKPLYSGHPWDVANWLLYKGGLIIQRTFNREVLFGTLLGGCFREVTFSYRFAIWLV